jgi:hypothetical protein
MTEQVEPGQYPFTEALAACRVQMREQEGAGQVIYHAQHIRDQFIAQFRPEEWPLVIRSMMYTTASIGGLEHHLALPPHIGGMVRFHLNVLAAAACLLEDELADRDPEARL